MTMCEYQVFVLVCLGCHSKMPQTEWLTQQKFVSHSYRGQKSKVSSGLTSLKPLLPASSCGPPSVYIWVLVSFSYEDCSPIGLGPIFFFLATPPGVWYLSSLTRDQTLASCIGRQSLNYWTAGKVPWSILMNPFRLITSFSALSPNIVILRGWGIGWIWGRSTISP